ncbi:MAG TPA: tetratricopeptide repeat protein [Fimbriimonadaceae bacterium]|nr:tetratricopeptide repeat protein [Fimbriimonadaceae bacterium]
MQQNDWAGACKLANELVDARPTMPEAHAYLGLCHYHNNDFEPAEECFRRATTLNPHYWEAGIKHVQCLDRLLRYEEAYELAQYWANEQPNNASIRALVHGLSFHAVGRTDAWQKSVTPPYHIVELTQD